MPIRIPSPEQMIVFSSLIYPSFAYELGYIMLSLGRSRSNMSQLPFIVSIPIYAGLLALVYKMYPMYFFIIFPALIYCLISIACVPLLLIMEYIVGYFFIYLKYGTCPPLKFSIAYEWREMPLNALFLSLVMVVFEELVFRQIWFIYLVNDIGTNPVVAIFIPSIIYGLNHISFGEQAIFQKSFSGIVYGVLYYISGCSILVPLLTHALQNITLKILGGMSR
ncbi:CPBP family intramembrane glutamic endopeptidase [Thermococcus sp.]